SGDLPTRPPLRNRLRCQAGRLAIGDVCVRRRSGARFYGEREPVRHRPDVQCAQRPSANGPRPRARSHRPDASPTPRRGKLMPQLTAQRWVAGVLSILAAGALAAGCGILNNGPQAAPGTTGPDPGGGVLAAPSPAGRVYVANEGSNSLSVIDV